jgi:hypothetical protein
MPLRDSLCYYPVIILVSSESQIRFIQYLLYYLSPRFEKSILIYGRGRRLSLFSQLVYIVSQLQRKIIELFV